MIWFFILIILAVPIYKLISILILAPLGFNDIEVFELEEAMIPFCYEITETGNGAVIKLQEPNGKKIYSTFFVHLHCG